jgi:tetratricopeptide (TPR) repeat protein
MPAELLKSVEIYTHAIDLDPAYAKAHGELSMAYFYLGLIGMGPSAEMFLKARASAAKALELDETTSSAHNAMAVVHIFYDWDWESAERESKRAVELSPGQPEGYVHLADYLSIRARHAEAIAMYDRVLELDPISRVYLCHLGLILHRARRYDESIAICRRALEIDPHYAHGLWFMALSLEQKGEIEEAIAKLQEAVSLVPASHFLGLLGRDYALAGDRARAAGILQELRASAHHRYVSPFDIAVVHAGLGELDTAFECFEEAYRQRVFRIVELTLPMFDSLHDDPRWQDLVQRVGLQP